MNLEYQIVEELVMLNNTQKELGEALKSISHDLSDIGDGIQLIINLTHFPEF
jgi:hypothetical protein